MAKTVVKCDIDGCSFERSYDDPIVARRVLGYHKRVSHNIKGIHTLRNEKTRLNKRKQKSVDVPPVEPPSRNLIDINSVPNYCPWCGNPVRRLIIAVSAISKHHDT